MALPLSSCENLGVRWVHLGAATCGSCTKIKLNESVAHHMHTQGPHPRHTYMLLARVRQPSHSELAARAVGQHFIHLHCKDMTSVVY